MRIFAAFKIQTEINKPCICYLSEPLLEVGKRYIHRRATRILSVMGKMWRRLKPRTAGGHAVFVSIMFNV